MKSVARLAMLAYALAILVAGAAPHCAAMFAPAQTAASHHGGGDHHGHGDPVVPKKPERDCAAMEMAKATGPMPVQALHGSTDIAQLPLIPAAAVPTPLPPAIGGTLLARGPPPRTTGGFAAVYASNHRLLI